MKIFNALYLVIFLATCTSISAQTVIGTWKTISDDDGKEKSYVDIYEKNGKFFGKIIKILDPSVPEVCEECKGDLKNSPMIGLEIIKDLQKDDQSWNGGKILDPANGKEYKCTLSLESEDVLLVRGFIGFSLLGRTQKWYRVN